MLLFFSTMKHFGSIADFIEQRNNELLRTIRRLMADAPSIRLPLIFEKAARQPCSRFWVSEERCAFVISNMLANRPLPPMRRQRRLMFNELFRRAKDVLAETPGLPISYVASIIVHQPAPNFFLTAKSIGEIYFRIKRGFYNDYRSRQIAKGKQSKARGQ